MGKIVSYKNNPNGEVKLSKQDRRIAKINKLWLPKRKIVSVDFYTNFLYKIKRK